MDDHRNIIGFVLLVLGGGVEVTFVDIRIYPNKLGYGPP